MDQLEEVLGFCIEVGLPVTETGGVLPCGATAVWKGKDGNS